jgi:hypothetical protein
MVSETSTTDLTLPSSPESPDFCPISSLLGKRIVEMDNQELEEFVKELRVLSESPQTLRTKLSSGGKKRALPKPRITLDQLM